MNRSSTSLFRALIQVAQPWSLGAGLLFYALGVGIARYLGYSIDWATYGIGQAILTMLQLSMFNLREYFNRPELPPFSTPIPPPPPRASQEEESQQEPEEEEIPLPRVIFLQVATAALTIGAVMIVLLLAANRLNPAAALLLVLAFILGLLYAVPPVRLAYSGYGELVLAILFANLFPTLAFLFQTGDLHRLLAMLTFPLTLLYLASLLALSLEPYYHDVKGGQTTMLVRLGWQRGILLHNILIALAYIFLSIAVIAGLPFRLAFPAFLSLPVGIFQIWQMNSIAAGVKPRWRLLGFTALATIGFTVYFMNLAVWTG